MRVALLLTLSLLLWGCEDKPGPKAEPTATATATMAAPPTPPAKDKPKGPPLLTPKAATDKAPDTYEVEFDTTKGKAVIKVTRAWAPRAADRFYNLVKIGFYDNVPFYRVTLEVAQFGIHADPKVNAAWKEAYFMDELVKEGNTKGRISFARRGSDTRTVQIFINLKDNSESFDSQGFASFGEVTEGLDTVIAKLSNEHGERTQQGDSPKRMMAEGEPFIKKQFPKLDWIKKATLKE